MYTTDFLPERIRSRRTRRQALRRQVVLMAVCVAGLAALAIVNQGRVQMAQAHLRSLMDKTANVERQLAERAKLEAQQADLLVKQRIDDELGSRVNALEIMAELERILPRSIFLTSLNVEAVETKVPVSPAGDKTQPKRKDKGREQARDMTVKRVRLEFTGVAPGDVDIANFIAQLSAGRLFEDVSMVYARNSDFRGQSAREFQAGCFLVK